MAIVGGLDLHRRQLTYDILDTDTGETRRGRIEPATSTNLRAWLEQLGRQPAAFALEATTGWQFVVDELHHAGMDAHLADRSTPSAGQLLDAASRSPSG